MRSLLLCVLACTLHLFGFSFVHAQAPEGTAVLIDVSGSMKEIAGNASVREGQPKWQRDVQQTINTFLFGGTLDTTVVWAADGMGDPRLLSALEGGRSLYREDTPLLVMHFGEISESDSEYYFSTVKRETFADVNEASRFFYNNFPSRFNDQWTYLKLAKAVARLKMREVYARSWYLIIISDSDEDHPPGVITDSAADALANEYATTVFPEALATFAYRADRRLKMEIWSVRDRYPATRAGADSGNGKESLASRSVELMLPAIDTQVSEVSEDAPLQFRWRPVEGAEWYTLVVQNEQNEPVYRGRVTRAVHALTTNLLPGQYTWFVQATGTAGTITSGRRTFTITSVSLTSLWFVLVLLLGAGGYYAFTQWQKKKGSSVS